MMFRRFAPVLCALALASAISAGAANAQPQPSAGAIAAAKELIQIKGALTTFDPVVDGVLRSHKNLLLQTNPNLSKDLDEIEAKLHAEFVPRRLELQHELAVAYAQHFTEKELKDLIAFYKTPLGHKVVVEEPKVGETSMQRADAWAHKFASEVQARLRAELKKKGLNPI